MYEGLKHAHSGLRWLVLIALVIAIIQAFSGNRSKRMPLIAMTLVHIQLLIGLVLYFFVSPITKNLSFNMKDAVQRFYGMEHFVMMVIATVLVTAGYSSLKKSKFARSKWLFLIGLIVILAGIPWPFRIPGAAWF